MSHLDEGTLHALLDGELDLAEVSEIQKHLGSCVACGSRLQEVKQVLAEADRLVGAVEIPAQSARARVEPPQRPTPPQFRTPDPELWNEPPVLLVPDPIDANVRRKRWFRGLRWAAVLAVVVYGGKLIGGAIGPSHPVLSERDLTTPASPVPPAVVSREEAKRPESTLAVQQPQKPARQQTRAQTPKVQAPAASAANERESRSSSDELTDSVASDTQAVATDSTTSLASELAKDSADEAQLAAAAVGAAAGAGAAAASPSQAGGNGRADRAEADRATRDAAAAALAELDRERRRERANAATAALPRTEPTAAESAPRPPTPEQRAQVYLRIGLDEAVKQLGGPVHVIEGMTPQFIGLTRMPLIPGSSNGRPVVRVVYTDARDRLILLDQQRMEAGQPAIPAGSLRWTIGDVMLYLRGDVGVDVLRSLQARVR